MFFQKLLCEIMGQMAGGTYANHVHVLLLFELHPLRLPRVKHSLLKLMLQVHELFDEGCLCCTLRPPTPMTA